MEFFTYLSNTLAESNPEVVFRIILQIVLLVSSAFFSGSETALFSLSRMDLQKLRNSRNPQSEKIHELLDEPRRLIISILCGNELVNIASTANMAALMIIVVGEADAGWLNIVIMVPLLLLVGEVTPKTFAVTFPIKFCANFSARLLPRWITLITPLREAVRFISDRVTTLVVGEEVKEENILQRDEFRTLVSEGVETGIIDATERVLIDNMLEAAETEIDHIMTPRTRLTFLDADKPLPELIAQFKKTQHPRVPVVRGNRDNILGFLHSEDVLRYIRRGEDFSTLHIDDILRPAHFVPPTKKVDEMFEYFRHHNTRAAILLGEYGGVHGMVTMKDVLTFLFGEISGTVRGHEHYEEEDHNVYTIPADMRLADFNNLTNFDVEDAMMTTVGGVAFRLFDRLPRVGDATSDVAGIKFTVLAMDGLRIKTLRVELTSFKKAEVPPSPESYGESENRVQLKVNTPSKQPGLPVEG
ncbi:MAG: HlyC/CorC family transporter [Magnetococcales bacterium]|nr:HlyC/CorC family transporter [Magnetococcales bacterium]